MHEERAPSSLVPPIAGQRAQQTLEILVHDVSTSAKYRDICPDLIRNIGAQELTKRRTGKEALKATKNKLHQIGGAYFGGQAPYELWLSQLSSALATGKPEQLQQTCKRIMNAHASTRERIPILDHFYSTLLADLAPIHSMLDLACGLNPLSLPWMPLAEDAHYYAYDIYHQLAGFLHEWFALMKRNGEAQTSDIIQSCPPHEVDVALVLKAIPCLEQIEKRAGQYLLQSVKAKHLVVSFPIHSLGGRSKGMSEYYEERFRAMAEDAHWSITRYVFATELVFVVSK